MSECAHDYLERELAGDPADGYCALCTKDRIAALEAELAEAKAKLEGTKGFEELMRRLYNDMPLLPYPEYSQDVAFIAHGTMSWRKEANERAKELAEAKHKLELAIAYGDRRQTALAEAKDEIIKLRADIIWIAKDRDDNRRWAEDRATVAVEMADQRDQARQALAERTRELELAKRLVSRLPMCSDHRDKFDPDHCQACRAIARASQGTE